MQPKFYRYKDYEYFGLEESPYLMCKDDKGWYPVTLAGNFYHSDTGVNFWPNDSFYIKLFERWIKNGDWVEVPDPKGVEN